MMEFVEESTTEYGEAKPLVRVRIDLDEVLDIEIPGGGLVRVYPISPDRIDVRVRQGTQILGTWKHRDEWLEQNRGPSPWIKLQDVPRGVDPL